MTLPVAYAVPGTGHADLRMVPVPKTDVENHMPVAVPHNLTSRHTVLFPGCLRVRLEDRVVLMLGPGHSIRTGGVADGVRFILLAAGIPHAVEFQLLVVNDVLTHDGDLLPRL